MSSEPQRRVLWGSEKDVILGDPRANKMLERPCREPWVYPKVS
jgi:hypothetical protein